MSRSRRKTPITGRTTAKSEKNWKRDCSARRRRAESLALAACDGNTPDVPDPTRGNSFGPKDGRMWCRDEFPERLRK